MFDIIRIQSHAHQLNTFVLWLVVLQKRSGVQSVTFDNPYEWGKDLMHALSVACIWVELRIDEQYIEHFLLRRGLSEEKVVLHTSLHILEDLLSACFILPQ